MSEGFFLGLRTLSEGLGRRTLSDGLKKPFHAVFPLTVLGKIASKFNCQFVSHFGMRSFLGGDEHFHFLGATEMGECGGCENSTTG